MKKIVMLLWWSFFLSLSCSGVVLAAVEGEVLKNLSLEGKPQDLAASPDGKHLFVLLEGGEVLVYSAEGEREGSLQVGPEAERIEVSPQGDRLYLICNKSKSVQIAAVDFIREINIAGSPFKGPAEAPVTIVVFSDFQCPYCARLVPLLEQVTAQYPKGVKLVFKNFPLRIHPFARQAAMAAMAAHRQGKFWPFHDLLFANYDRLDEKKIRAIAQQVGLDMVLFDASLKDRAVGDMLNRDISDGREAGVGGTPTIFVNGRLLKNRSLGGFRELIDKELGKAEEQKSGLTGG